MREPLQMHLDRLLKPRSIALVGASRTPGLISSMLRNIVDYGFQGRVYAVNPRYDCIGDVPCYPSLLDIPDELDHVLVAVPNRVVPEVLRQAEEKRVGIVNIISSGYGETGDGESRQAELTAWSRRSGIRVVGPNCLGVMSMPGRLNATIYRYQHLRPGEIAFVLQSGQMSQACVVPCLDRRMGVNYVVTSGNEADLQTVDYLRYFIDDPDVRVIGCFTEQVRSPERLIEVAELAADARKPIVMLKIGRTEASQRSARAHTGALVGSHASFEALARRHGITPVRTVEELVDTIAVMHSRKLPRSHRVGTVLLSGGAVGLLSDLAPEAGVEFPGLPADVAGRLRAIVPEFGPVGNPLDITAQAGRDPKITGGAIGEIAALPDVDIVLWAGPGVPGYLDAQSAALTALRESAERHPDKVFLVLSLSGGTFHEASMALAPVVEPIAAFDGVPFLFGGMETGLRAIAALARYGRFQRERERRRAGGARRLTPLDAAERARRLVQAAGGRPLTEREGKQLLALYSIGVTLERLATTADAAVAAARAIGYPVVLKIESPQITHKTEAGGVRVGVADDAAVAQAFAEIIASARRYDPSAEIAGVLVQEQVAGGQEVILGASRDPQYGPTVLVGLGGIFVEVLKDTALRVPPLEADEAREMLDGLRGRAILDGVRGQPAADVEALVEALARFSELVADLGELVEEIDVNPLVVLPAGQGVRALDCLIVPARAERAGAPAVAGS